MFDCKLRVLVTNFRKQKVPGYRAVAFGSWLCRGQSLLKRTRRMHMPLEPSLLTQNNNILPDPGDLNPETAEI